MILCGGVSKFHPKGFLIVYISAHVQMQRKSGYVLMLARIKLYIVTSDYVDSCLTTNCDQFTTLITIKSEQNICHCEYMMHKPVISTCCIRLKASCFK